jgi:asparagine synthase (glutamine-hydrolysing)
MSISHDGMPALNSMLIQGKFIRLAHLIWQLHANGQRKRAIAAQLIGPYLPPNWWAAILRKAGKALDLEDYSALQASAFDHFAVGSRAAARGLDLSYRPWHDGRAMRLWVLDRVDMGVYIKGTLAGWGIDLRDPTADRRLIELCLRIPEQHFIAKGVPRALARRAFADRLPQAVISERRRGIQGADWPDAIDAAYTAIARELDSLSRNPDARLLLDLDRMETALHDWPNADRESDGAGRLYLLALLRGVAAGHFLRRVGRTN